MNNIILSFIITFIAGFSTVLGIIPCFLKTKKQDLIIARALAFASGVMITISLVSLIPESASLLAELFKPFPAFIICAIFIIMGIILSTSIDSKVEKHLKSNNLYKLGIITTIVLIIHNLPEGITTFISTNQNQELGLKLAFAIALHNIPEDCSCYVSH